MNYIVDFYRTKNCDSFSEDYKFLIYDSSIRGHYFNGFKCFTLEDFLQQWWEESPTSVAVRFVVIN